MTISMLNDDRVLFRMNNIRTDNRGIAKRPGYSELSMIVVPALRKEFQHTKLLPSETIAIEQKFLDRVTWPRSVYIYRTLLQQTERFKTVKNEPLNNNILDDTPDLTHCWQQGRFTPVPNLKLPRNVRALKKAAGLPYFGKKGDNIVGMKQYNETHLRPLIKKGKYVQAVTKSYSVMPGYRTQQAEATDETNAKVRLVWSIPGHIWYEECCALDDAITRAIAKCAMNTASIQIFYLEPKLLKIWVAKFSKKVNCWVNLDSTQFDSTVQAWELDLGWRYFCNDINEARFLATYAAYADLVMPGASIDSSVAFERSGGMPSGSKGTNLIEGKVNVEETLRVFKMLGLLEYVVCILVNGDDITVGFSTHITNKNLLDFSKRTIRETSADKSAILADTVWNSKWFINNGVMYRPLFRAMNSLMYQEHQSNPITGTTEYVAIARAQILADIEEHPLFDSAAKLIRKYDTAHLSEVIDTVGFIKAADLYVELHDYNGTQTTAQFIAGLKNSRWFKEYQ